MPNYSEEDLKHAAEFREGVHRQALERLRQIDPDIREVVDRYPVEAYFEDNWEYPGRWYTYVAVPPEAKGRKNLIDTIVRDTLAQRRGGTSDVQHGDFEKLFTVSVDQERRAVTTVGRDKQGRFLLERYGEYSLGSATGSFSEYDVLTDAEFRDYAAQALAAGALTREEYDRLCALPAAPAAKAPDPEPDALPEAVPFPVLADYPDAEAIIYIVEDDRPCRGLASHRRALAAACRALAASESDGGEWRFDLDSAQGWPVSADAPFALRPPEGECNLRRAVLDPPHGSRCDEAGFAALCDALFPRGRSRLEVFAWSTDWWDFFDDGHEWWGAMCYTVYDRSLDRYAVLLASATD